MYCKKCGWKLNDNDVFCPFCKEPTGKPVVVTNDTSYQPINDPNINDGIRRDVLGYEDVGFSALGHAILAIGMYFGYQVLGLLLSYICLWTGILTKENQVIVQEICSVIAEIIAIGVFIFIIRKSVLPILKKFLTGNTWKWAGIAFAALYGANFIYNIILTLFKYQGESTNQSEIIDMVKSTPVLAFLFVCILAPVIEEIIFRFGLFRALAKINDKLAIALTTFIFAFMHMIISIQSGGWELFVKDLPTFPAYLIGAFAFTYIYYKTKNIATSMCAHFINNTLSFIGILILPTISNPATSEWIASLFRLLIK